MNAIYICAAMAMLFASVQAYSMSQSCFRTTTGEWKCSSQNDPNGNIAAGGARVSGRNGEAASGAGTWDNFNTDYQRSGGGTSGPYGQNGEGDTRTQNWDNYNRNYPLLGAVARTNIQDQPFVYPWRSNNFGILPPSVYDQTAYDQNRGAIARAGSWDGFNMDVFPPTNIDRSYSRNGGAFTGTRGWNNYNTAYPPIGNGDQNNPGTGGQDFGPNSGIYGGGAFAGAGTGYFPPGYPQFNGDPFQFVQDFFSGRRR